MRWIALLGLIIVSSALSSCATGHRYPDPPAVTRCQNLKDHFRCHDAKGKPYNDPYPGKEPMIAYPVQDDEARANYIKALRQ